MKILTTLLALVVLTTAAPVEKGGLRKDLEELRELLPVEEIEELAQEYISNDEKMLEIMLYTASREYYEALQDIAEIPEIVELGEWIQRKMFAEFEEEESNEISKRNSDVESNEIGEEPMPSEEEGLGGWDGFFSALSKLWPEKKFKKWFAEKLEDGSDIGELYRKVQGMKSTYEEILQLDSVDTVIDNLEELGVDFITIDGIIKEFFGW